MDVQILSKDSLKIKIKKTTLIVNPRSALAKTEADAILATEKDIDITRVNDYRVLIDGAGEYEVSGLKILAQSYENGFVFDFISENADIVLSNASTLAKIPADKIKECSVAIINTDTEIPANVITSMEPHVIVFYGDNAKEAAKSMGKEGLTPASKVSFPEDKLPEETEVYLLS